MQPTYAPFSWFFCWFLVQIIILIIPYSTNFQNGHTDILILKKTLFRQKNGTLCNLKLYLLLYFKWGFLAVSKSMAYFSLVKKLSEKSVSALQCYKFSSGTKKVKKMNTSSLLGATHQSKILTWKSAFRLFFLLKTTTNAQFIRSTNFSKCSTFAYFSVHIY